MTTEVKKVMQILRHSTEWHSIGDIAKIGHLYYECIGDGLWLETENQKYNF
jgi:hypothetical protein